MIYLILGASCEICTYLSELPPPHLTMIIIVKIMIRIIIFRGRGAIDGDGDNFCLDPLHLLPFCHLWFKTGQRAWVLYNLFVLQYNNFDQSYNLGTEQTDVLQDVSFLVYNV